MRNIRNIIKTSFCSLIACINFENVLYFYVLTAKVCLHPFFFQIRFFHHSVLKMIGIIFYIAVALQLFGSRI